MPTHKAVCLETAQGKAGKPSDIGCVATHSR